jgi:hypothetical protein
MPGARVIDELQMPSQYRPGLCAWAQAIRAGQNSMLREFVQDEALEHGLLTLYKHQMPRKCVQGNAREHGLFKDEHQIPGQFVQDNSDRARGLSA